MEENPGAIILSGATVGPLMISGAGRSGTTAMMRALCAGGMASTGSDLDARNAEGFMTQITLGELHEEVRKFSMGLNRMNVVKVPMAVIRAAVRPQLREAWGGNWLIMVRDPVALAGRERHVSRQLGLNRSIGYELNLRCVEGTGVILAAQEIAQRSGVMLVSYEKLLAKPEWVMAEIEEWLQIDLDAEKFCAEIIPSDPRYINEN